MNKILSLFCLSLSLSLWTIRADLWSFFIIIENDTIQQIVLGETHNCASIEQYYTKVQPFIENNMAINNWFYAGEIYNDFNKELLSDLQDNLLIAHCYAKNPLQYALIDMPKKHAFLDLSFSFAELFDESIVTDAMINEFFIKLGQFETKEITMTDFLKNEHLYTELFHITRIANKDIHAAYLYLKQLCSDYDINTLALALRCIPSGINYRNSYMAEKIASLSNYVTIIGNLHMAPIYKLLQNNDILQKKYLLSPHLPIEKFEETVALFKK